jgi:hypothetical protein
MRFNRYHKKVNLPTANSEKNDEAILTGWGANNYYPHQTMPDTLQKAKMHVLDNAECAMNLPFTLNDGQMCVFEGNGIGACIVSFLIISEAVKLEINKVKPYFIVIFIISL